MQSQCLQRFDDSRKENVGRYRVVNDKLLAIYLNDHLAGAAVGIELARRSLNSNRGTPYEDFLERLADDIEEDKATLEDLMNTLGVTRDRFKQGAAWIGEKVGRLKLNGQLTGYSPLSRLEEFEGLSLGITGKLGLWRALKNIADHDSRLAVADFEPLIERAEEQRRLIEEQRLTAVEEALT